MTRGYCLLLGLDVQYRERALAAALRKFPGKVAAMRDPRSTAPSRWADIVVPGDPQVSGALRHVIDFENRTGLRPAAVVPLSEFTIAPGSEIARHYGLPYLSDQAVSVCRNKLAMRNAFLEAGLAVPRFTVIRGPGDLRRAAHDVGFPAIIKPSNLGTSVGVCLAENYEELETAFNHSSETAARYAERKGLPAGQFQLEEYVVARREVVALVQNQGEVHTCFAIADTFLTPAPHFAEMGHIVPSTEPSDAEIRRVASAACSALGISLGISNVDIRVKPDGRPIAIEVNARPPGTGLMNMTERVFGVNFFEHHILDYSGQKAPSIGQPPSSGHSAIVFVKASPGTITKIRAPSKLPDDAIAIDYFAAVGDVVSTFTNGNSKDGAVEFYSNDATPYEWEHYQGVADQIASECFVVER